MKPNSSIAKYSSLLGILVAAFVIHGSVLGRFWLGDDPQVLLHAVRYGPLEIVSEKEAWQELSTSNFTPLVTWSFDLDLSLLGPRPALFYVHQVLSIGLVALALYLLMLTFGAGRRASLALGFLFLAAPPTIHVAGLLMTRHYVEGLLAAVISTLLWVVAAGRTDRRGMLIAGSVAAYFVAVLAKEAFVLLPLILVALAANELPWRRVVIGVIPFGVVTALYLAWRSWILESAGGYGGGNVSVAAHLVDVTVDWAGTHLLTTAWLGIVIVICCASWLRARLDILRFVLIAVASLAPLAGIGDQLEGRHLLFPAVVALCGAVGGLDTRLRGLWRSILLVALVLISIVAAGSSNFRESREVARMEAEGRYVWDASGDALMLLAGSPGWYVNGIAELDLIWRDQSSPEVVFSELGALLSSESSRYVTFGPDGMKRANYLEDISTVGRGYDADAPLELKIHRNGHELQWQFGPRCDCQWRFYSYPAYQGFNVPREGSRVVPRPREPQWFRIERRESSGIWTLSPPLSLPSEGETARWKRDA